MKRRKLESKQEAKATEEVERLRARIAALESEKAILTEALADAEGCRQQAVGEAERYASLNEAQAARHLAAIEELTARQLEAMRTADQRAREGVRHEAERLEELCGEVSAKLAKDLLGIDDLVARLTELAERVDARGRKKERTEVQAIMNRATLGCQRARQAIREANERHQARLAGRLATPGLVISSLPAKTLDQGSVDTLRAKQAAAIVLTHDADEVGEAVGPLGFSTIVMPLEDSTDGQAGGRG
jgi:hypothetical protein